MTERAADGDLARFSRPRFLPGTELVSVAYRDRAFPVHIHPEYVVGTVTAGAEMLEAGGRRHIVAAGDVLRLHPGEPHANCSLGEDILRYQVFYLPEAVIRPFLDPDRAPDLSFETAAVGDAALARVLVETHAALADEATGPLEQESAMMTLVRALTPAAPGAIREVLASGAAIDRVRDYIDDRYAEPFGLSTLSNVAGLSAFHLVRSFKKAVGLSPLAYRNQRRIIAARHLLRAGHRIADVAQDVGFADQSHLTRQFQKIVGISPARYIQQ